MKRADAVAIIYTELTIRNMQGGLPRAIEIYNYIGAYGEIEVTSKMIREYFNK